MTFCTDGLEVTLEEAAGTFVDVLWCRFQGADEEAQKILNNTQNDILNREVGVGYPIGSILYNCA
jgi:hypothetical protein